MLWNLIKVTLVIIISYLTFEFYRFSKLEMNNKSALEKFMVEVVQDNKEHSNYLGYSKIIGVFKTHLDRVPSIDELRLCHELIQSKKRTFKEIESIISKEKEEYVVTLFPNMVAKLEKYKKPEAPPKTTPVVKTTAATKEMEKKPKKDVLKAKQNEKKDKDVEIPVEKPIVLKDDATNVRYILNRPTIYNITAGQSFQGSHGHSVDAITRSVSRIVDEMESNTDRDETISDLLDKQQCMSDADLMDQNKLAVRREDRNMNELSYACNRSQNKNQKYSDKLWNVPRAPPPVCKMGSKKCTIVPMEAQDTLLGTLIEDAKDTKIGSIMPTFNYKEKK